jgi:hypothetical protein
MFKPPVVSPIEGFNRSASFKPQPSFDVARDRLSSPASRERIKEGKFPWRPLRALREIFRFFGCVSAVNIP